MRHVLASAAIAATLSIAGAAFAQAPPAAKPTAPATGAPSTAQPRDTTPSASSAGANASANAGLMSGMSVKDKTGAIIGEVKSVNGGQATIQMGTDTFSVDSGKLGVSGGAATINATQAELKQMLAATKK